MSILISDTPSDAENTGFAIISHKEAKVLLRHCWCPTLAFNLTKADSTIRTFSFSSDVYIFLKAAAQKKCMASGCLQAVAIQLQLLTQPKFPGQGGAQTQNTEVFSIKTGNHGCCRSDHISIFYEYKSSNYVASPHFSHWFGLAAHKQWRADRIAAPWASWWWEASETFSPDSGLEIYKPHSPS